MYYYIPKSYENTIVPILNSWLENNNIIIITGVYQESNILNETDSLVFNVNILGETSFIRNGYKSESDKIYELIGYCLEANLYVIMPDIQEMINNVSDILQFNTSEEYLEYINTL